MSRRPFVTRAGLGLWLVVSAIIVGIGGISALVWNDPAPFVVALAGVPVAFLFLRNV